MYTETIPGTIVRFFTNYKYNHVLISLDNTFSKMYSFGRKTLLNPLNAGFIVEDINGPFFQKFNKTVCRIYSLTIKQEQFNNLKRILEEFEKNGNEYKYDFVGAILKYFLIPLKRKKYYVCSQFVAEVLKQAQIFEFDKPTCLVMPKDFENIEKCLEVYNGLLLEAKRIA